MQCFYNFHALFSCTVTVKVLMNHFSRILAKNTTQKTKLFKEVFTIPVPSTVGSWVASHSGGPVDTAVQAAPEFEIGTETSAAPEPSTFNKDSLIQSPV